MALILVLEDHPFVREMLAVVLERAGHEVLAAASGPEALALLAQHRPDLVISDMVMPGMDGFEFVRRLRADPALAGTRVIFQSEYCDDPEARAAAGAHGVHHFLAERTPPAMVVAAVDAALAEPRQAPGSGDVSRHEPERRLSGVHASQIAPFEREAGHRAQAAWEQRVREERAHLVIDASLDAFVVIDLDNVVVDWNRQAVESFGWTREEAIGRDLSELIIPPRYRAGHERGLAAYKATGKSSILGKRIEIRAQHRERGEFPVQLEVGFIPVQGGALCAAFIRDISERVEMERALREREGWLHRSQVLARLAHVVTGADGAFESWSETLPALIGHTVDTMPKHVREWMALVHPDDRRAFREAALDAARSGRHTQVTYRFADGESWTHLRHVMEQVDAAPPREGTCWMSIIQDVTELTRAADEVRALNASLEKRVAERTAELEAANKELEAFGYTIAHDLRAPLNRIRGFGAALLEDHGPRLDEKAQGYLRRMVGNSVRMDEMVRDLLALSMVTKSELRRGEVDLSAMVGAIFEGLRRAHPERDAVLEAQPEVITRADAGLLRLALDNLLGNAWKFTLGRTPARITFSRSVEEGQEVFHLGDNGIGFDVANAQRLFEPFQRLDEARGFEGAGIGLATVRRIVHRHGGRIWASATPGRGAAFHFTLSPH